MILRTASHGGISRAALFGLPAAVRCQISQHGLKRSFSATSTRQESWLVEAAIAVPMAVLDHAHAAGLPWYAAIPATAIVMRGGIGYFLADKPRHRRKVLRSALSPLSSALKLRYALSARNAFPAPQDSLRRVWSVLKIEYGVGRRFGLPVVSFPAIFNFFTLLATSEAIRLKLGAIDGPIRALSHWWEAINKSQPGRNLMMFGITPEASKEPRQENGEPALASQQDAASYSIEDLPLSQILPDTHETFEPVHFDPSTLVEGLSWCIDLSIPDPSLVLQAMIPVYMSSQFFFRPGRFDSYATFLGSFDRRDAFMAFLTAVFYLAFLHMPAGINLYVLASLLVGRLQQLWLQLRYPIPPRIEPCSLPPRKRVRQAFGGRI